MITERGEIWPRAGEYDIWAATRYFRSRAAEYRRRRLLLQLSAPAVR